MGMERKVDLNALRNMLKSFLHVASTRNPNSLDYVRKVALISFLKI